MLRLLPQACFPEEGSQLHLPASSGVTRIAVQDLVWGFTQLVGPMWPGSRQAGLPTGTAAAQGLPACLAGQATRRACRTQQGLAPHAPKATGRETDRQVLPHLMVLKITLLDYPGQDITSSLMTPFLGGPDRLSF